jgi:methyl-accepting chemotaxis protein
MGAHARSARDIQELVKQIQDEVKVIADGINQSAAASKAEVEKGKTVNSQLEQVRGDMVVLIRGAQEIAAGATQSDRAAKDAQKGSETIAASSEEQSAACEEVLKTVEQQNVALGQSQQASQSLADLADELKNSTDISKSAEAVAASAEELSSAVQEIDRAATQILAAIDQISKGAQQQSSATEEAAAAAAQIEKGAQFGEERAKVALEKGQAMAVTLGENKTGVEEMIQGLFTSLEAGKKSQEQMKALELISRKIDKIVDAIVNVSIQTNMLAVNGAVEAARAGEYGKGFAVVSTDIRNLARESAENAERIKDVVKAVQDQIGVARRDLEEIGSAALSEVEKAKAITSNLTTVETDMGVVLKSNTDVQQASVEIVRALSEAKKGIDQIATAAEQTNKAAEQSAAAAKQQAQGAKELARAIEEVASLADELQNN